MPPHPLTNFEIQKYYQDEPKFNRVYSRNSLSKIQDEAYMINLDEYELIGAHSIALSVNERIPKEITKFIGNKNIITNIYRIQAYDSIIRGYFCIGFIDFMLNGKHLLDYTKLFSPDEYKKNGKIVLKYFQL